MSMEPARFTLRIHPIILKKLKIIADNNGRSVNREIEQILKWIVDDYENKCGKIKIDD
ncbi:MAG: Arc family DNA-binding protein [Negativicutes bacterium]|nr:Arc family DNA-binding protein [Negativicutes bacterium]